MDGQRAAGGEAVIGFVEWKRLGVALSNLPAVAVGEKIYVPIENVLSVIRAFSEEGCSFEVIRDENGDTKTTIGWRQPSAVKP